MSKQIRAKINQHPILVVFLFFFAAGLLAQSLQNYGAAIGFPLLAPDGDLTHPQYSWASNSSIGWEKFGNSTNYVRGGNRIFSFENSLGGELSLQQNACFGWTTSATDAGASIPAPCLTSASDGVLRIGQDATLAAATTIQGATSTSGNNNGGDFTVRGGNPAGSGARGFLHIDSRTFAQLGTPVNDVITICTDCTIANPCAGAGNGALAKRLNGIWVCN